MALANLVQPANTHENLTDQCRKTATRLVAGFAAQDIDAIMGLIADDAIYCDVRGKGPRGGEYQGKAAIQAAFLQGFRMLGDHTYELHSVIAEGQTAFTSWTLVLGRADDPSAPRFDGADHFEMDEHGQVLLKKGWLKGQPELNRKVMRRNPLGVFRHPLYALFG
jgi:ketosteroid isomerase-like protein